MYRQISKKLFIGKHIKYKKYNILLMISNSIKGYVYFNRCKISVEFEYSIRTFIIRIIYLFYKM